MTWSVLISFPTFQFVLFTFCCSIKKEFYSLNHWEQIPNISTNLCSAISFLDQPNFDKFVNASAAMMLLYLWCIIWIYHIERIYSTVQESSYTELRCFLWCHLDSAFELTMGLLMIWDAMMHIWLHYTDSEKMWCFLCIRFCTCWWPSNFRMISCTAPTYQPV